MTVTDLLLEALDKLGDKDFKTFKWRLSNNDFEGFTPIPEHQLANAEREDTVSKLTSYGDETAVTVAVKVLRKMNKHAAAQALEKGYRESEEKKGASSTTSSSSADAAPPAAAPAAAPPPAAAPAAAPSSMSANNGSVIFAPIVNDTQGPWNITINKS